jgi:hypothetical protein
MLSALLCKDAKTLLLCFVFTEKYHCVRSNTILSKSLLPIENLWFELKREVHNHRLKDIKDLERFCTEEWSKIRPNVFYNLIKHLRKRLSDSIENRYVNNLTLTFYRKKVIASYT